MSFYDLAKNGLRKAGLLPLARRMRAGFRQVEYLPENMRYWRGKREDVPVPPLALIDLVSGQPDIPWFLLGGQRASTAIREALGRQDVGLKNLSNLLDFGCGCGRVLRNWSDLSGDVAVHGTDLNPRLVKWCQQHLAFARVETNGLEPPLPFPDSYFDLVYSLSVFTHLPEHLQQRWMDEVRRVLAPSGYLVFSTHGEHSAADLDRSERARFAAGTLVVRASEDAGSNACGAYHPSEYVRATLASGFDVLDHVPQGALGNPPQDLWVLQKTDT